MDTRYTPREIFEYYAKLRGLENPSQTSQDIIDYLNLERAADTIIGDNVKVRGISGGEKKRVNVGIELVSSPNLLFLDEPTTGLDSTTAFEVLHHIQNLKRSGITVITTIHSPSAEILEMFDNLIILCDGFLVFEGKPKYIRQRIKNLNFEINEEIPSLEQFLQLIDRDHMKIEYEQNDLDLGENDAILNEQYALRIEKIINRQRIVTQRNFNE